MILETGQIPLKRPHYHLRGNKLFFLISKRPQLALSATGVELWKLLDGLSTVGDLERAVPDAREILAAWWDAGVIEMAQASFDPGRRKVLVVEPHMDDAVLSVGGMMWERRETHEFTVVTLVGISNFTSYHKIGRDYFDTGVVSELRRRESELVMRLLGGRHVVLDWHDAPLRYQPSNWTLDWFLLNRRSIAAFINHAPVEAEVRSAAEGLRELFMSTDAAEIWIPMGVGTSTDHETTRNACLIALADVGARRDLPRIHLYQDVPYAMNFPRHSGQILEALNAAGASLSPLHVDVSSSMPAKLRLVSIFASQFKMSYMGPRVEQTARLAAPAGGRAGELLVDIDQVPAGIDFFELYSGRDHVRDLTARLGSWARRHQRARRVTLLCPMGVGRWRESMETLLESFPDARIDIHLTADGIDETARFESPRIRIHPVTPRGAAWLRRTLRVLLSGPRPLVVLTGWKFCHLASVIRAACFPFDALTSVSVGHLVLALHRVSGHGAPHPITHHERNHH